MRGLLVVAFVGLTLGGSPVDGVAGTYSHRIDAPVEIQVGDPEMPSGSVPVSDGRRREGPAGIYAIPIHAPDIITEGDPEYPGALGYARATSELAGGAAPGAGARTGRGPSLVFVRRLLRLLGWSL